MFQTFANDFQRNFIADHRWRYLTNGLAVTLEVTFFAVLLGVVLGFSVALVREAHRSTGKFRLLSAIGGVYLTVIRGTPGGGQRLTRGSAVRRLSMRTPLRSHRPPGTVPSGRSAG